MFADKAKHPYPPLPAHCPGLFLILLLSLCLALPAWAQVEEKEDKKDAYLLQAVTVSAQKREENVQEVPSSVGVLDDAALDESRVNDILDIQDVIPNLYMGGGATTSSFISIRGRINGADIDMPVTVLVDDVPYDEIWSVASNLLFDVERVEVLRGSQSTLYGLNSLAGVIKVVTKKPSDFARFRVGLEGGLGPDYDGSWLMRGSASGPLVEGKLAGGLAFMTERQGGYVKNNHTGDNYNSDTKTGVRGSLVWTPSDAWDVTMGLTYTKVDADYGFIYLPMSSDKEWEMDQDWEGESEVETWAPNLKITYDAGSVDLVSITAYRHTDHYLDYDYDLTSSPNWFAVGVNDSQNFSQEFRVQSSADQGSSLEWVAGVFHYSFERDVERGWGSPATPSAVTLFIDTNLKGYSNALFGQATYRLLDRRLGLTLGARQEWTNREFHDNLGAFPDMDDKDSQFLPKVALDYRISPDAMVYASVTQGWRCGGLNNRVTAAVPVSDVRFKKETSWTYEIGAKTQWLDNHLTLNASVFHTVYEDYQDKVNTSGTTYYLQNVPEVHMTGFELETEARITEDLLFTGSLGYVRARYEDFPDAIYDNFNGNTVTSVPNFDLNLAFKYSFLDGFYVRPELQGVGRIYWDRINENSQSSYALLNIRAGYSEKDWEIYAYGDNLTNRYVFVTSSGTHGTPITPFKAGLGMSWSF